ncbi:MAG TPA: tetratricopeptide repeat protein [Chthonomonadaceae bacterium]|nr:tetratricopeptide repeat protein [Chthonomonadaceae bacterium]
MPTQTTLSRSEETPGSAADPAEAYLLCAEDCTQRACYEQALEAWKQVIYHHPDSAYALLNIGGILTELHCWPEAIAVFQQAARLQPDLKEAHYGLGMSCGQLGYFGPAIEAFQHAMHIPLERAAQVYHEERTRLYAFVAPPSEMSQHAAITFVEETPEPRRVRFWERWRR